MNTSTGGYCFDVNTSTGGCRFDVNTSTGGCCFDVSTTSTGGCCFDVLHWSGQLTTNEATWQGIFGHICQMLIPASRGFMYLIYLKTGEEGGGTYEGGA